MKFKHPSSTRVTILILQIVLEFIYFLMPPVVILVRIGGHFTFYEVQIARVLILPV
uniref:Uncharacterized protein n=1 Tax=Anguilla anguilla TaxID=7936 RepID=A0A0E9X3K8_ANGAN